MHRGRRFGQQDGPVLLLTAVPEQDDRHLTASAQCQLGVRPVGLTVVTRGCDGHGGMDFNIPRRAELHIARHGRRQGYAELHAPARKLR